MQSEDQAGDASAHKIVALERLQKSIGLTEETVAKWIGDVLGERRASAARSCPKG